MTTRTFLDELARKEPVAQGTVRWDAISLQSSVYLTDLMPPNSLITSIRGVVLRGDQVLVMADENERYHIVPGGRREGNESIQETLRREILEETGWTFINPNYLGFVHYHHLTSCPDGYQYPYPDFIQLYFVVQADEHQPEEQFDEATLAEEYVFGSQWLSFEEARTLPMDEGQSTLLLHLSRYIREPQLRREQQEIKNNAND